ncbi:hypothetical protein GCM10023403_49450 [Pseudonocardia benzenivorans]|uniref:DUF742 domain-containing protein n=2 Tax=Pseudonocardia TaxID=1847 RepID=F4CUE4_PSEUX|nr:protein of unknown function DUF742 [Pseudonocardia dioxanivorans CB1190]
MAAEDSDDGGPVVGRTGARFGGASRRRRHPRDGAPPDSGPPDPGMSDPLLSGAAPTEPVPVVPADAGSAEADAAAGRGAVLDLGVAEAGITVRPYVLTGGRTRPPVELGLETLVSTRPGTDPAAAASPAHRAVLDCCDVARSVAEVAATTRVPLGVARVLIGDLAALDLVSVHGGARDRPDQDLMARVLDGLRRL